MEVILTQDVPKLGRKYEVKKVKAGYGENFLIKNGLAYLATPSNVAKVSTLKDKHDAEVKAREDALQKSVEGLEAVEIKLSGKANEKGHLFAGIDAQVLVYALKEQANLEFNVSHIVFNKPLKEVGEHMITIKVGDREVKIKVTIEAEK